MASRDGLEFYGLQITLCLVLAGGEGLAMRIAVPRYSFLSRAPDPISHPKGSPPATGKCESVCVLCKLFLKIFIRRKEWQRKYQRIPQGGLGPNPAIGLLAHTPERG